MRDKEWAYLAKAKHDFLEALHTQPKLEQAFRRCLRECCEWV